MADWNEEVKLRRTADEYMADRVRYKIKNYTEKAHRHRLWYLTLATIAAAGSALVPVLINVDYFGASQAVATILSLLVAIAVALEGVFHHREHWKNYDLISSYLRQEEMRLSAGARPYAGRNPEESFRLFVERVEDAIAKERAETVMMRTSRAAGDDARNGKD